jgi:hypothetical protein
VDRIASSYDAIMAIYREFVATLGVDEQRAVLFANAMRTYQLPNVTRSAQGTARPGPVATPSAASSSTRSAE